MDKTSSLIAVVDDEQSIRRALLRLLRSAGFNAQAFASGRELLSSLAARSPQCVVLDLNMPDMSGYEVAQQLHRIAPETGVVVMTGNQMTDKQQESLLMHVVRILNKPMDDQLLLSTIQAILNKRVAPDSVR
ncbi:MAG: response regulator [Burkholderiales bacterium]|nr:response regulator [Burkholderiales bacterium]